MAKKKQSPAFTPEQAQLIVDAHDLDVDDEEEAELFEANNPELAAAYKALIAFASNG